MSPKEPQTPVAKSAGGDKAAAAIRRLSDPAFPRALGALTEAIGQQGFEEKLLAFAGRLVPHDWTTLTRYSRYGKPDYLVSSPGYPTTLAARYLDHYYQFDPFYLNWRERQEPGVISLNDLSSARVRRGRYLREFLVESGIRDEVGLFLPPLGGASVALFLERRDGRFTPGEIARLRHLYPILAGLHRAHVRALFGGASSVQGGAPSLPEGQPIEVTDKSGNQVFANAAWHDLEKRLGAVLRDARRDISGPSAALPGPLVLHREALDEGFRLAPGGTLWTVEARPREPGPGERGFQAASDPASLFVGDLTPRERDIVGLILQGYPTISIAARLGLSRGTVKNHRRRIYDKLDITSERELFLTYIGRLQTENR